MKKLLCMALSLGLIMPAGAQPLSPALGASLLFGGASAPQWHWRAAATQTVYAGRTALAVPVIAVDFDAASAPRTSLLGLPLQGPAETSNLDGERRESRSHWVWIVVGVGAVATVAVLAAGGSSKDNNNDSRDNTSCSGVSGDVVGPNPPMVGSGCTTLVSGGS